MSQENVEIVRRVIDVMDAEGFEAALPVFLDAAHSDVEWREDPAWPGSAAYRGVEQVRQVILDRMDTLGFDQQTEELISVGDRVVALVRWVGRGKTSGAQGEISMAMVWTVRDQAIARLEFFLDRAQALAAVGLSESAVPQENVDLVRRMLDAFNRGDVGAVIATFGESCLVEEPQEMPDSPSMGFRGHDGIRAWMANLRGVAGVRFEPRSFTTGTDVVVCDLASHGSGQGSGAPVEWTTFAVLHMCDGKIARARAFLNRHDALEAAGLAE